MPRGTVTGRRGGLAFGQAVDVEFHPSPFIMAAQFDTLGVSIRSFREPLMRSIKQVVAPSMQRNFDESGRPEEWQPLEQATEQRRQREGYSPGPPLVRSGRLRRGAGQQNIWHVDGPNGVAYIGDLSGFQFFYGAFHQGGSAAGDEFGTIGFPPRPWAMLQDPEDLNDIEEIFFEWIEERVERIVTAGKRGADI
jgi:phage gpG-like protein